MTVTQEDSTTRPSLPDWARQPFEEFLDHQRDLSRVLHLSMQGISMLRGRHSAIQVLAEIDDAVAARSTELEAAAHERALAQTEVDNGFPLLHEQASVFLWGSLEAFVRNFCSSWLRHREGAWQSEAVLRLRVRLGEYESLDPAARSLWVIDLLDQEVAGPLKMGVNRFEALLNPFGLDGPIDSNTSKKLFELAQVRNVIVHRRGRADRRLIDACPWLNTQLGERVSVRHAMWREYNDAVAAYVLELIQRVRVVFGVGRYSAEHASPNDEPPNHGLQPTAPAGS